MKNTTKDPDPEYSVSKAANSNGGKTNPSPQDGESLAFRYNAYYPLVLDEAKELPLYIAVIGIVEKENGIFRPKGIEHYQLLFTKSGEGTAVTHQGKLSVKEHSVFIIPPNTAHNYRGKVNPWKTYCITFNGIAAQHILKNETGVFRLANFDLYETMFFNILECKNKEDFIYKSSGLLYPLLLQLKKDILSKSTGKEKTNEVIKYMEENYNRQITLPELARIANLTPQSFCRSFKSTYKVRPFEYITLLRIQKAKELLTANRELSISEISRIVGYSSASYFGMLFKKYEKITPETFREFN